MSSSTEEDVFKVAPTPLPEERAARLDQACAGEAHLRRRVEAMVQAEDQPGHRHA